MDQCILTEIGKGTKWTFKPENRQKSTEVKVKFSNISRFHQFIIERQSFSIEILKNVCLLNLESRQNPRVFLPPLVNCNLTWPRRHKKERNSTVGNSNGPTNDYNSFPYAKLMTIIDWPLCKWAKFFVKILGLDKKTRLFPCAKLMPIIETWQWFVKRFHDPLPVVALAWNASINSMPYFVRRVTFNWTGH